MNDEQYFLANAYLDGELTDEERAIAEADPDVMSEVELLRALQADIRAVDPPTDASRESAIAAAMAEFTSTGAGAAATAVRPAERPAVRTVPFRPRPRYARYLSIAAAVVVVGLLGVVVVMGIGGGGDDDDTAEDASVETVTDAAADEATDDAAGGDAPASGALPESLDEATDDAAEDMAADEGDDMAESDAAADDGGLDADMADDADAMAEAESPADAGDEAASDEGFFRVIVPATTPASLPDDDPLTAQVAAAGAELLEEFNTVGLTTPNTDCQFADFENPAIALDRRVFETEAGAVELLVYVDELNGIVYGVDSESDADTCVIVIETALP
ncbi:MAG: hypothetical protein QNJ12_19020 [Ilumatobacter sp.]|uniref:anti-sigma factor family protein n=1 Tax=Ilumatobacter sp. TaxID=1967498 RepID=UPI0026354F55|nr:hypothetical protein [Ilumatobacter sp.]MDJ0770893.1 hypothetical protein [Ilumatobacter sp.]